MLNEYIYRTYSRHSEAVYAESVPLQKGLIDSFSLAYTSSLGGVTGEFCIECSILAGENVFQIKSFSDSVKALLGFSDVLAELSQLDNKDNIATRIEAVLKRNNIVDNTIKTY